MPTAGRTGIGTSIAWVVAPTPTPISQVFGGRVPTPLVDGFSAAQNMKPSMPAVVPSIIEGEDAIGGSGAGVSPPLPCGPQRV